VRPIPVLVMPGFSGLHDRHRDHHHNFHNHNGTGLSLCIRGDPMTSILIIDPRDEKIIHNIQVESKDSAKRIDQFFREQEIARGHELERVIVSMNTVRIMDRNDKIPVPVFTARQDCTS
jgi:hypothetical protein